MEGLFTKAVDILNLANENDVEIILHDVYL